MRRLGRIKHLGGQRFVRHFAAEADWAPWREAGFVCRDIGIEAATDGLAGVRVVRPARENEFRSARDAEFLFGFVLEGQATLHHDQAGIGEALTPGSAFTIPGGESFGLSDCSVDFELLDITLPARL